MIKSLQVAFCVSQIHFTSKWFLFILLSYISFSQVSAWCDVTPNSACDTLTVTVFNYSKDFNGNPVDSIIIDYGDGTIDTIPSPNHPQGFSHTFTNIGDYIIKLTAIKDGFSDSQIKQPVHVYERPDSDFDYDFYGYSGLLDTFYYSNRRYLFTADYENDTTHQWWINGELQENFSNVVVHNFENSGNQTIKHKISFNGCADSTDISISITESETKIPNVFSPNGDGQNDVFYIQTDGNMNYKFTVINRHGSRVFVHEGQIISWDGRSYWGDELSPGNYFYVLEPDYGEIKKGVIFLAR